MYNFFNMLFCGHEFDKKLVYILPYSNYVETYRILECQHCNKRINKKLESRQGSISGMRGYIKTLEKCGYVQQINIEE